MPDLLCRDANGLSMMHLEAIMRKTATVLILLLCPMISLCIGASRIWEQCGYDCGVFPDWFPVRLTAIGGVFLGAVGMALLAATALFIFVRKRNDGA